MAEPSGKTIRAFIGIPLPESVHRMLGDLQYQLKKTGIQASWPNPAGFHLTLKFLGATSVDNLIQIQAVMDQFCGKYPELFLTAGSVGVFPDIKKARVIWTDIRGQTRRLEKLFTHLDGSLHALGFSRQSRPFSPHITLARIKVPVHSRKMVSLIETYKEKWSDEFHAQYMNLYKSRLTSAGAIHTRLFQVKL